MNASFSTKSTSSCVAGVSSRRITREEVVMLRSTSSMKKTITHMMAEAVHNCCRDIQTLLNSPVKKSELNNSMCKYYGHVIQGAWQGHLPKCADCGSEISSPDQLRKSSPMKK